MQHQWLEDNSLQIFGGPRWKDELLHRVQRVEDRHKLTLGPAIASFRTRRINLTLRYVPDEDVVPFAHLAPRARADVADYMTELAAHSPFFARALAEPASAAHAADRPPTRRQDQRQDQRQDRRQDLRQDRRQDQRQNRRQDRPSARSRGAT